MKRPYCRSDLIRSIPSPIEKEANAVKETVKEAVKETDASLRETVSILKPEAEPMPTEKKAASPAKYWFIYIQKCAVVEVTVF